MQPCNTLDTWCGIAVLKRLYDSVVDEPLPDAFTDLLNKLDAAD